MSPKHASEETTSNEPENSLGHFISSLASHFLDYPGFMWTNSGFEVLHANWPAYPSGKGLKSALAQFGDFPSDIEFSAIDNIDQCTLFVVKGYKSGEEFDAKNYHMALWDEDIRELARHNYIKGISLISDEIEYYDFVSLSERGENALLFQELTYDIHPEILSLAEELVIAGRHDTAIREADLFLETRLRQVVGMKDFGQRLIDKCFGNNGLLIPPNLPNPAGWKYTVCLGGFLIMYVMILHITFLTLAL